MPTCTKCLTCINSQTLTATLGFTTVSLLNQSPTCSATYFFSVPEPSPQHAPSSSSHVGLPPLLKHLLGQSPASGSLHLPFPQFGSIFHRYLHGSLPHLRHVFAGTSPLCQGLTLTPYLIS